MRQRQGFHDGFPLLFDWMLFEAEAQAVWNPTTKRWRVKGGPASSLPLICSDGDRLPSELSAQMSILKQTSNVA
jgi:hypothetical protein